MDGLLKNWRGNLLMRPKEVGRVRKITREAGLKIMCPHVQGNDMHG